MSAFQAFFLPFSAFQSRLYNFMHDGLDFLWVRIKARFISSKQLLLKRAFLFQ